MLSDAMPELLVTIDVYDGDVVFVGLVPTLVSGSGDIDNLQVERKPLSHSFDDEQRAATQRTFRLGEECHPCHGAGVIKAFTMLPDSTARIASSTWERLYRFNWSESHKAPAWGVWSIRTARWKCA